MQRSGGPVSGGGGALLKSCYLRISCGGDIPAHADDNPYNAIDRDSLMGNNNIAAIIDRTLNDLFDRLDRLDHDDIDLEMSDGKLVIEFGDGIKYIVNRQSAADQIWLAEPQGGWHFDYRDGQWIDDKRGVELIASLDELMSAKLGEEIAL